MRKLTALILTLFLALPVYGGDSAAEVFYSCNVSDKRIALTFDDGPHFKYTEEILDILDEFDIPATFFVVGQLAEQYPDLVLRELEEGHEIASHTWSHPHIRELSAEGLEAELKATEKYLFELAGYKTKLFRPPEGKFGNIVLRVAGEHDYKIILWTVDTRDWAHTPPSEIVTNVLETTRPGSIILCHDCVGGKSPTPEALREFIPKLKENGYEFVTVSELLNSEISP